MLAGTQKPMLGMKLNRVHPLADGLVGCWLFNEGIGNVAYDTSGYGNHGTLTNMAFPPTTASGWNPNKGGVCLAFNGSNDYCNCGNESSLDITEAITIEARVKTSANNSWKKILAKANSVALNNHDGWHFTINSGTVYFGLGNGTGTEVYLTKTGIDDGNWHHIVGTWNDSTMKLYKDAGTLTQDSYSLDILNNEDMLIGAASSLDDFFNGSIDGVKIYNRALSASEIKWTYREPYAMFERGELLL